MTNIATLPRPWTSRPSRDSIDIMATRRIELGTVGQRVASNLAAIRASRQLNQPQLAQRINELGREMTATVISKTEKGDRRVDVDDLVAFAVALGVTPNRLLLADASGHKVIRTSPDDETAVPVDTFKAESVDLTPMVRVPLEDAWAWAAGDRPLPQGRDVSETAHIERSRTFQSENRPHAPTNRYFDKAELLKHPELVRQAAELVRAARHAGVGLGLLSDFLQLADMTLINGHADVVAQPVVVVIVTSAKGVLVTRRTDGDPPWGFVAGEVHKDPAERPEDAAAREVKEETGLEVRTGEALGRRIHPRTDRELIYIAAKPVRGTTVIVGDPVELAEVRWVSLAEADELMPDMFGPVHDYLARTLR